MSINSNLQDPTTGNHVNIIRKDGLNGIVTINNDLKTYKNKSVFFSNPEYGSNLNNDFTTVLKTENIHNGNDNTYWSATTIIGNINDFDFSSTDQAHTGSRSIDCSNAEENDMFQLSNTTLISDDEYDNLIGWIYVDGNWTLPDNGVEIFLYNTNESIQVSSNTVDLDDYIDGNNVDTWQRFIIPLSDFGTLSLSFNAIRFRILAEGQPPDFYLDDLLLEDIGGIQNDFKIEPPRGTWWHVLGLGIVIVSPYNSILADSSIPNIPYNGFLGETLTNGFLYRRQEEGEIQFSIIIKDLIDILNQYNTTITSSGYDGNFTWIKIDSHFLDSPYLLKSEYNDYISIIASDDLSNLQYFRMIANIKEENRNICGNEYKSFEIGNENSC